MMTLVPRQDLTGADRTWAERYQVGDVLRYSRASKETGIGSRVRTGLRKSLSWDKVSAATARSVRNSQHAHDS